MRWSDRIGSDLSWSSLCASSSSPSSCPDSNQLHHSQKGFVLHDVLTSFFLSDGRSVDRLMDLPFRQPKPITNHDRTNQNLVARVSTTGGKRERERGGSQRHQRQRLLIVALLLPCSSNPWLAVLSIQLAHQSTSRQQPTTMSECGICLELCRVEVTTSCRLLCCWYSCCFGWKTSDGIIVGGIFVPTCCTYHLYPPCFSHTQCPILLVFMMDRYQHWSPNQIAL